MYLKSIFSFVLLFLVSAHLQVSPTTQQDSVLQGLKPLKVAEDSLLCFNYTINDTLHVDSAAIIFNKNQIRYNYVSGQFEIFGGQVKVLLKKDSLILGLGDSLKPGVIIKNEKLESIRLIMLDTSCLFGLTIVGDSTVLNYNADSSHFIIFGGIEEFYFNDTSESTGIQHKLKVNFGKENDPGVKINTKTLDYHFNLGITDTLHFDSSKVAFRDNHLYYDKLAAEFMIFGGQVDLNIKEAVIHLGLGTKDDPGLKIKNKHFKHLRFSLLDTTKIFGLQIRGKSTTFEYDTDSSTFAMYGGPDTLIFTKNNSEKYTMVCNFGDKSNPGLLIKKGQLKHLNFAITDTMKFSGLCLSVDKLSLSYDKDSAYYKIFGGPVRLLYKKDSIELDFGLSNAPGMLIQNGKLQHVHLGITAGAKFFGFDVSSGGAFIDWNRSLDRYELGGPIGLRYGSDSLYLVLGDTANPGLIFKDGKLEKLEGNITSNLKVHSLEFKTNSLGLKYNPEESQFEVVNGSATLKINEDSLQVAFGHKSTPGLVLKKGAVTHVDVTLSSHLKLFKLGCDIDSLTMIYNAEDHLFEIYGGPIGFAFEGDTIKGFLGNASAPGALIRDGKWQKFSMGIDGKFKISKFEIEPHRLTFAYDIPNEKIIIYDSLSVIMDNQKITCKLGDFQHPGIVIKNSKLDSLFIAITSDIHLGGLELITKNAGFKWNRISDTTELFGEFIVKEVWSVDLSIGTDKNPGILIIEEGNIPHFHIDNIKLELGDAHLGSVIIDDLVLEYLRDKNGEQMIDGSCKLLFSNAFQSHGYIKLKNTTGKWKPDSLYFDYGTAYLYEKGIAIGSTGLFLQKISGSAGQLENLANATLTAQVNINDGVPYKDNGFMMYMEGKAVFTKNNTSMDTKLLMGAYHDNNWKADISTSDVKMNLNWVTNKYKLNVVSKIPTDYGVLIEGDISLSKEANVFYGDVGIRIPSSWWLIGGTTLGNVSGALLLFNKDRDRSYAAGWTHFKLGCTCCRHWYCGGHWCRCLMDEEVGLKYKLNSHSFEKIGASDIDHIKREVNSYRKSTATKTHSYQINITQNAFGDMLAGRFRFDKPGRLSELNISIMGPSGLYSPDYFTYDTIHGYTKVDFPSNDTLQTNELLFFLGESFLIQKYSPDWKESFTSIPKLIQLEHGQYEIVAELPADLAPVFESSVTQSSMLFDLGARFDPASKEIKLTTYCWIPEIPQNINDSKIFIFADNDTTGYDGRLISSQPVLKEYRDNGIAVHETSWAPFSNHANEKFYFYAVISDSSNKQKFTPYTDAIEVFSPISGKISNILSNGAGIKGNIIFIDLNGNGKLDINQLPEKDSFGNIIPHAPGFDIYANAEPSCVSDSLGNFFFDINRYTGKPIANGKYKLDFYIDNNYQLTETSPVKREHELVYDGKPVNVEILIENKQ